MLIAFVHTGKAFMPEIIAYNRFFSQLGIRCVVCKPNEVKKVHAQVEWYFLGRDSSPAKNGIVKIHEYCSASQPPFRKWKNRAKRIFNTTPDYRIFLNEYVKKSLGFTDRVPFGFRDMGIPADWLKGSAEKVEKTYDFIYIGETSRHRRMERLLNRFTRGGLLNHNILLVSHNYEKLQKLYAAFPNIRFEGPHNHEVVREKLSHARFAINFIPDEEPFNHQSSTKFLEYAACRLPIISTDYYWVRQFQQSYGGQVFYLQPDLTNLSWEQINAFSFGAPDLTRWTWEQQIRQSGVLEFLKPVFPFLNS